MASPGSNPLLTAALLYASFGWRVVAQHTPIFVATGPICSCQRFDPPCENQGKHPRYHKDLLSGGLGSATTSLDLIQAWWDMWPQANIGVATGLESGLVVLDIDPDNGGKHSLDRLEAQHGRLPPTAYVTSGRGLHLYFRHPEGAEIQRSDKLLGAGIELKSQGAGITAPPSMHYLGREYFWPIDPSPTSVLELPAWIAELARKPSEEPTFVESPRKDRVFTKEEKLRRCRALVDGEDGATKGGRKQTLIFKFSQLGLDFDLDLDEYEPILISWADRCDPPLDHRAVFDALKWAYRPGKRKSPRGCKLHQDSHEWLAKMESSERAREAAKEAAELREQAHWARMAQEAEAFEQQSASATVSMGAGGQTISEPSSRSRKPGRDKPKASGSNGNGGGRKPPPQPPASGDPDDEDTGPGSRLRGMDLIDLPTTNMLNGPDGIPMTDIGNGQRLIRDHGRDMRFAPKQGKDGTWYLWTGAKWTEDKLDAIVSEMAKKTMRSGEGLMNRLKDKEDKGVWKSFVQKSEGRSGVANGLYMAGRTPGVAVGPEDFDADDFLINTPGGIVDIRTLKTERPRRSAMMAKITACASADKGPSPDSNWMRFLDVIMEGDQELIEYLQRAAGYTLTGSTREECFFFCYGTGKNGKSTFLNAIQKVARDYAKTVRFDTFMDKKREAGAASNDIARLVGARMVIATEPPENQKMDEALMKQLTGQDMVTCRFLFSGEFEYQPRMKIWLAANHQPQISGVDEGIWRRIRLIPFAVQISEAQRDRNLAEKLKKEYPEILRWLLEGACKWYETGLPVPKRIQEATDAYRIEMDRLADFIATYCVITPNATTKGTDMYAAYKRWADESNERVWSNRYFGQSMRNHGFESKRGSGGINYLGIGLLDR